MQNEVLKSHEQFFTHGEMTEDILIKSDRIFPNFNWTTSVASYSGQTLEEAVNTIPKIEKFSRRAVESIYFLVSKLPEQFQDNQPLNKALEAALQKWVNDEAHGVKHSYDVFERMKELLQAEIDRGNFEYQDVSDEELEVRAILHDLGEFLPAVKLSGKIDASIDNEKKYAQHPLLIAAAVLGASKLLRVPDGRALAQDLWHHDDFWKKPSVEQAAQIALELTPAGKLLADADRLVGNTRVAIDRNRRGSLGAWYILRPEMTAEEHASWQVRTKGYFAGSSALLAEFFNKDHYFYTESGRELNRKKIQEGQFDEEFISYYQTEYANGWWELERAVAEKRKIYWGIRDSSEAGKDKNKMREIGPLYFEILGSAKTNLTKFMNDMVKTHVDYKKPHPKTGRLYYGYSINIPDDDGNDQWLDPSILLCETQGELLKKLQRVLSDYKKYLQGAA